MNIMEPELMCPRICTSVEISPDTGIDVTSPRLAVLRKKAWPPRPGTPHRFILVSFLGSPSKELQDRILLHLNAWGEYCAVHFVSVNASGDIRIAFNTSSADGSVKGGYWSTLGTDAMFIDADKPTMNLEAWNVDISDAECRRVIRHEAGHAMGFPHEHLRAEIVERIDREKAIAYYLKYDAWDEAKTVANVLTPLNADDIVGTDPDELSIMCYQIPGSVMKDGVAVLGGLDISATDGAFAKLVYNGPRP